ncbi:MAG TPA: HD domain-containing phosphohydrolase, partial [Terriglobia bacterium]|nr:HD domain-containing phosphohydrolase [Terriglobia bacterium]
HHEKYDGSGYPDGLRGEAIPITARILQLADVYDALTTERPYKKALSLEETLWIMQEEVAKGWWDPHLFEEFRLVATDYWRWQQSLGGAATAERPGMANPPLLSAAPLATGKR